VARVHDDSILAFELAITGDVGLPRKTDAAASGRQLWPAGLGHGAPLAKDRQSYARIRDHNYLACS
jgi:hypothetical protein